MHPKTEMIPTAFGRVFKKILPFNCSNYFLDFQNTRVLEQINRLEGILSSRKQNYIKNFHHKFNIKNPRIKNPIASRKITNGHNIKQPSSNANINSIDRINHEIKYKEKTRGNLLSYFANLENLFPKYAVPQSRIFFNSVYFSNWINIQATRKRESIFSNLPLFSKLSFLDSANNKAVFQKIEHSKGSFYVEKMGNTKKRSISAEPVRSATTNIQLPASIENSTNSIERIDYTVNKHLDSDIYPTNRSNSKQTKSKITKTNTETSKETKRIHH